MSRRAILLDALGTLLELAPPASRLQAELARRYGVEISQTEAREAMAAEIGFYRAHLEEGRDPASLARLREQCAGHLRGALPEPARRRLPQPADLVDTLLASLEFRAYSDALPALRAYRYRGVRLVVVSNWDVSLHAVLRNAGLAPWLDGILTAAEAGVRKPAPGIFTQALALAGVSAGEAVHVGDSLEEDVAGARGAGIQPVLVCRHAAPAPDGVRTVRSLEELVL
ncbi:MAG: HAD-IA family hydrolase [Solirubrobacterales bacterium]|nr:HAD-IA family hydrolase [Solirubrobacterales bacterium]